MRCKWEFLTVLNLIENIVVPTLDFEFNIYVKINIFVSIEVYKILDHLKIGKQCKGSFHLLRKKVKIRQSSFQNRLYRSLRLRVRPPTKAPWSRTGEKVRPGVNYARSSQL